VECQKSDWKAHKIMCRFTTEMSDESNELALEEVCSLINLIVMTEEGAWSAQLGEKRYTRFLEHTVAYCERQFGKPRWLELGLELVLELLLSLLSLLFEQT
jgi:hypothetical protein